MATAAALLALPDRSGAVGAPHDRVVSAVPGASTPHAVNGTVFAIAQVGSTVLMGGTFTQVQPANRSTTYDLPYVVAFDAATGAVNTAFAPALDNRVETLLPGPTAGTVYVGGAFNTVGGVRAKGLVLLNVSNGSRVAGFTAPPMNGIVQSVKRSGNRLFVGGTFTTLGTSPRGGLGSLDATTGALDSFLTSSVAVNHSWTPEGGGAKAAVGVFRLDLTPDGSRMVAIGNFKKVDGLDRDQIAMWDLTGATAVVRADWRTRAYEPACYSWAYDTYVRDLDFSPDGSYFVVATTGGGNTTLCDTAARWATNASGDDVQPVWSSYAGGDSLLSVAVTGTVVYVGGHQRWMNNPSGNDFAGGGAVPRPGLAALDPATGMPLAWNPGRNPRGAGAYALLATPAGLWVGSDTEFIGNYRYRRGRIAFFPLAGGAPVASNAVPALPAGVYLGAPRQSSTSSNVLYRVNAGGGPLQSADAGPDWTDGGGNVSGGNTAGWSPVPRVDATVPSSTPWAVFDSERWGEQHWSFPVPSGAQVQVRLYFANRYGGTAQPGQRVFSVGINGTTVLSSYDIVADVGNDTGTMKAFPGITAAADGNVHVDFSPQVENPLINGIEIVRTDVPAPAPGAAGALVERNFTGSSAGPVNPVDSPLDFSQVRGATLIGGTLFYGKTDSTLYRRSFDGTTFGAEQVVDPYNDPVWSDVDTKSGQTYRGAKPSFYGEIPNLTSMFYDGRGRLYYTLFGQSALYSRAFSPDSGIVHNLPQTTGATLPDVTGAFLSGSSLYYVTRADGNLSRVGFADGQLSGTPQVVSGPAVDGVDWRAKVLFLGPAVAQNAPPVADAAVSCTGLACSADGSGSTDSDGTVASYAWAWGDGGISTGRTASHTYTTAGTYTVTLTVTDDDGDTGSATRTVTVAPPAQSPIAFRATAGSNGNTTSAQVGVPAAVQPGDALVLVLTTNDSTVTVGDPTGSTGWTRLDTATTTGTSTTVWSKVATAADTGKTVAVGLSAYAKADLRIAAYSGTSTAAPVAAVAKAVDTVTKASHTTPTATVVRSGSWVLSYWSDKSATTAAWTAPVGETVRAVSIGTGAGHVTSLLTDGGREVATGTVGGLTATTDTAGAKATMLTLVLAPAD
jgi:PKD repeat protein